LIPSPQNGMKKLIGQQIARIGWLSWTGSVLRALERLAKCAFALSYSCARIAITALVSRDTFRSGAGCTGSIVLVAFLVIGQTKM
jgi:hypothetical protein